MQTFQEPSRLSFFTPIGDARQLMDCVINFKFDAAKKMLLKSPSLMFDPVKLDPAVSGNPASQCSPLQMAFWALDHYSCIMFYEAIKDDPVCVKKYYMQLDQVKEFFDIQPLIRAYDSYITFCKANPLTSEEAMAVGNRVPEIRQLEKIRQREILFTCVADEHEKMPLHFILEMCRPTMPDIPELNCEPSLWNLTWKRIKEDGEIMDISACPPPFEKILIYNNEDRSFAEFDKLQEIKPAVLLRADCSAGVEACLFPSEYQANEDRTIFSEIHSLKKNLLLHLNDVLNNLQSAGPMR